MSNKRKAAPPWRTFAWGVLLSVGLYLLLLVLLTWRRCACRARQTGTQSM